MGRVLVFVLTLGLFSGCEAPRPVREAAIQEAVIFDSVTVEIRGWIQGLPEPTAEHAQVKARVLELIDLRRGEYRSLHQAVRRYLETDELARAYAEAEPVFRRYLEWLIEGLRDG